MQTARAAHPAHDLVQDEQHTMAIADLAHRSEIAGHRHHHTSGGAPHGFGHEADDALRTDLQDGRFQFLGQPKPIGFGGFVRMLLAVGIAGRHMRGRHQ